MTAPLPRSVAIARTNWLTHRNAALTRENGALRDQHDHAIQVLARVALIAANNHPGVAREIVAVMEHPPEQPSITKDRLLQLLGGP